jgi:hypothetical protein
MYRESRKHQNAMTHVEKSHFFEPLSRGSSRSCAALDDSYGTGQMPCSICQAKEIAIRAMKAA